MTRAPKRRCAECMKSALPQSTTCARHTAGYIAKPRAAKVAALPPVSWNDDEMAASAARDRAARDETNAHLDRMCASAAYRCWHHMRNVRDFTVRLGEPVEDCRDQQASDEDIAFRIGKHMVYALISLVEWVNDAPAETEEAVLEAEEQIAALTGPAPTPTQKARRKASGQRWAEKHAASAVSPEANRPVAEGPEGAACAEPALWSTTRDGAVVIVQTPSGPHRLEGFDDARAVEVAREMHERDVGAGGVRDPGVITRATTFDNETVLDAIFGKAVEPVAARQFHLAQMDCIEWLRSIGDETIDLAVTDSAYQSLEKHRAIGTTTRLTAEWFPIFGNERQAELLAELYRVLKRNAHCYLYCDQETAHFLWALMFRLNAKGDDVERTERSAREFPFTWWKHLTWMKSKASLDADGEAQASAGMGYHYRAAQECIVFLEKGKRKLNDLGVCDVLAGPRVRGGYPTEKPVSVSRVLIEQSSAPGELVIDPFLGSGSTGDASLITRRRVAGCDVVEKAVAGSRARLLALGGVEVGPPPRPVPPAQRSLFA